MWTADPLSVQSSNKFDIHKVFIPTIELLITLLLQAIKNWIVRTSTAYVATFMEWTISWEALEQLALQRRVRKFIKHLHAYRCL